MSDLAPLVPADVDLKDFRYMQLDVVRLRDSGLVSKSTGEEFRCAVLLWCASWHQIPAASLPDDDEELAQFAGFGRVVREWRKVKAGAMRGWVLCSDGRLYHPVVAEKALDAWRSKLFQRWKTETARVKKHNQRHGTSVIVPEFESWLSLGCPFGQALPVPEDTGKLSPGQPPPVHRETTSKREGKGIEKKEKPPNPPAGGCRFDEFWSAWPASLRKGGRPECSRLWSAKKLDAEADAILAHVKAMAVSTGWTKANGEFVPAPVAYLRGRRWDGAELANGSASHGNAVFEGAL